MKSFVLIITVLFSNICIAASSLKDPEGSEGPTQGLIAIGAIDSEPPPLMRSLALSHTIPKSLNLSLKCIEELFKRNYIWTAPCHTIICLRNCFKSMREEYDLIARIDSLFAYKTFGEAIAALQSNAAKTKIDDITLTWDETWKAYKYNALNLNIFLMHS